MRDRLIELIDQKQVYGIDQYQPESHNTYLLDNDELADHLLDNGVIVPPCKVGDKVYYLTTVDTEKELNATEIFEGNVLSVAFDGKDIWVCAKYTNGLYYYHTADKFGKEVFLMRMGAEKALVERREEDAT